MTFIGMREVAQVSLCLVSGSDGNLVFGEYDPAVRKGFWALLDPSSWWGREKRSLNGFIGVQNAEAVMRTISEAKERTL